MSLENQFEQELHNRAENIDKLLESYLPKEEGWAKCVAEAMNYSITAKGKRLSLLPVSVLLFYARE